MVRGLTEMVWLPLAYRAIATALLIVGIAQDLRTRKVAKWVTWSLLGLSLLVRCAEGLWILIAFLLLVHLVDLAPAAWRFLALGLVFAAAVAWGHFTEDGTTPAVVLAWVIAYGAWRLRILGGADARIVMGLMGLYPNVVMALSLGGGLVIVSTVWLFLSLPRRKRRGFLSPARLSQALPCSRTGYNILGPTWFWTGLHGGSALTQCRVALPETRHSQIVYGLQSLRLDRLRTAPTRAIWRQTPNRFYPAKELLAGTQYLLLRYQEQYSTDVLDTQERKKRRSGLTPAAPFLPIPEGRGIRARSSAIRRKEMLASLRSAGRNMAALEFATRETVEAVARPLTPALAFGALVYMWILIWLVPAPPM